MTDLIGRTLGQYRIVERIGAGGMATIYKAYQPSLDRYVALKVLAPVHAEEPGFNERFQREARAVANLNHPNILPVFDFGQEEGYSFIAMRYVEGARTLKEVMDAPLSLDELVDLIAQIAGALDYAHGRGVVHRDVKPSNVLMDGDWALLTDFGIAKITEASVKLTGTGVGIGTPAYMSPEQGQGIAVDHRTDIYSLGVILFEMLTGQIPHDAETPFAIVIKRITEPLPPPRSINPEIPEPVERVILKALATAPDDRFSSAGEMAQALARASAPAPALPGPPIAPGAPAAGETTIVVEGPAAPPRRRTPLWLWGLVGAVILILALGVWSLTGGEGEQEPAVALATETPTPTAAVTPGASATLLPSSTSPPPTATSAPMATSAPPTATPTATASPPPTATPTPTAPPPPTVPPTATVAPLPTPTPTREPVVAYRPIPLGAAANADSDFLSPPVGAVSFSGVPFELAGREFKSQASPAPNNGYPTSALLSAEVPQAYRVHLLLTTGNGYSQFDGSVIGRVVAYCDGSAVTVTDLVLGRDVREWHAADDVVSNASRPRQVWSGAIRDFPDLNGYYDMLSLDLPGACQSGRLNAVEIVDSSATSVNSLDPALNLIGVSVEYYQ